MEKALERARPSAAKDARHVDSLLALLPQAIAAAEARKDEKKVAALAAL